MTIYLDDEYKCHTQNDGTMREIETDFFDGKCTEYIEGYRFVPAGETWTRSDGVQFKGEMITTWKPYDALKACQNAYEEARAEVADMQSALAELGVTDDA